MNASLQSFRLLVGKPLLAYTAETALAAARLSKVVLSTDDEDVAEVGRRCGLESLARPVELSPEDAGVQRVVQDAVRRLEAAGDSCDAVCILDPASPFRRPEDIDRCIELLERSGADCVATVIPVPRECHPHSVYFQKPGGWLTPGANRSVPVGCPEDLPPAFRYDGSVCVIRRDALMNRTGLFEGRTAGYVVDPVRQVNLERPEDWGRAERIAKLGTHQATAGRIAPLPGPRWNFPAGWAAPPIADPLVPAGVALWKGALGSSAAAPGKYREPVRKAADPRCHESRTPFGIREALLPAERALAAHERLDPIPPTLVVPRSQPGRAPAVSRIENPFRPHAELLPGIQTAETPVMAALAGRRIGASGLKPASEPGRRENGGGSHVRRVAVQVQFTEPVGKGAHTVQTVRPFRLPVAAFGPTPTNRALTRTMPQAPSALAFFRASRPPEPASGDFAARELLVYTPAFRREGGLLSQPAKSVTTRVEVFNTHHTKLPGALPLRFVHPVAGAPPALMWSRWRASATTRMAEGWALSGRESTVIAFGSIESRPHGVAWPTARTFLLRRQPERPAKAGIREKIDPCEGQVFPALAATIPSSAGFRIRLQEAPMTKAAAPSIRTDTRTLAGARPRAAEFPGSGEPLQTPIFHAVLKIARMPQGVFHYLEIEDYDDHGTRERAPHYGAAPLMRDSGCDVRLRACLAAAGYRAVPAEPHRGMTALPRTFGELRRAPQVTLENNRTGIAAMDFAAIAAASSPRWRLSLKKTGIFT
jgi:CMP-N-acetylneuraminic acid synthetase